MGHTSFIHAPSAGHSRSVAGPLGCDHDAAQALGWVGVRVPDSPGRCARLDREGAHHTGRLLLGEGRVARTLGRLRACRRRRSGGRRRGHGRADGAPVRHWFTPAHRRAARGGVQGLRQHRRRRVQRRGRPKACGAGFDKLNRRGNATGGVGWGCSGAERGGSRAVRRRAGPRASQRAGALGRPRALLADTTDRRGRLRPDVQPGEVGFSALGRRPVGCGRGDRGGARYRRTRCTGLHRA